MRPAVPPGSHLSRKGCIYRYRRRLPDEPRGREVVVSLGTPHYREAEHRAALVDRVFDDALARARRAVSGGAVDLNAVLRNHIRSVLDRDIARRMDRQPGHPVYASWWEPGDPGTATDADLKVIRETRASLAGDLSKGTFDMAAEADAVMRRFGLPDHIRQRLEVGLCEVAVRAWDVVERRTLGLEPLILDDRADAEPPPCPAKQEPAAPPPPSAPLASALVEPFFVHREAIDGLSHHDMSQERTTLRLFADICGDKPINSYGRADASTFLATLRRLPVHYGKSPKDKGRSATEIIAEADAKGAARITDKTVKRHLTALSQFLRFAMDQGHITKAARDEMVGGHRFREKRKARGQRDAWTSDELKALFASPVWTGCHPIRRAEQGAHIIRDARFWLPILALYHGARLEEFADLYGRDVWCDDGTWAIRLVETEDNAESGDRNLKSDAAVRVLPVHPELVRLGFLAYVESIAPTPDDPLFPDLKPQGRDKKRGPRMTRWFVEYRKAINLYRPGVAMHAFRHTAITRLSDAITSFQQERHRDHMMGHASAGGGEGRIRYDKGPGLKSVAATLALLGYPEVDLSHLWVGPE